MNRFRTAFVAACICLIAVPASAALKVGDVAPNFTGTGSRGGKTFTFNLADALKKGPVVLYFFPSAYTQGCDLEAHTFATEMNKFTEAGASVVGVSADNLQRLKQFSADPHFCAGKFPIVSDESTRIAATYKLKVTPAIPGAKDVRGVVIGHGFIERFTYVIAQSGKIVAEFSSQRDHLTPPEHVYKSLAVVRKLKAGG
ncbi:MAG: redoxin domain-containing protein [Alphaproteobacteria bacterium]|nr:redoxin domain-containing protein [Alphaproteobacteria bacterium]